MKENCDIVAQLFEFQGGWSAVPDRVSVEESIRQITGVVSARVFADGSELSEIHVLSNGERHPKQVARDVESCLMAGFGIHVDHRRISVAEVASSERAEARFVLESVLLKSRSTEVWVEVELSLAGQRYVGRARGPASSRNRLLLAVQATLDAIEQACPKAFSLVAEDVGRFEVAGEPVVAALVALFDGRVEERQVGVAYVRRDEAEAAVKATLAALNRRLALHLGGIRP